MTSGYSARDELPQTIGALRDEIVARTTPGQSPILLEAVARQYATTAELSQILQEVLEDPGGLCEDISHRSYVHPLGFDKYVLLSGLPQFQARLHVWWAGQARTIEHVHNHRFDLASAVVQGQLEFEVFRRAQSGMTMVRLEESLQSRTLDWEFRQAGKLTIERALTASLTRGSSYSLTADTMHRVTVDKGIFTATLFIETRALRPTTTVLVAPCDEPPRRLDRTTLSVAECKWRLQRVIERLSAEGAVRG